MIYLDLSLSRKLNRKPFKYLQIPLNYQVDCVILRLIASTTELRF